ncbi:sugar ABC transporter substrate-binding protein [Candidatus Aerophobetes bacterium]|nr:sugar ABC transporter substrate-binding protein [Candidatus Aerophobetes bacterium]
MSKIWKVRILAYILLFSTLFFVGEVSVAREKLTVWIGGHVVEQETGWAKIVKDFEASSGIDVEYRLIGFEVYYSKLITAFEAGEPPDICFADLGGWVPVFASHGWLESIDNKLDQWKGAEQIWENLWPTVSYKGKRYGLPWYTDDRALMYNFKMFRDAGLDPNNPPERWYEFLGDAMLLTNPSKGQYGYGVSGAMSEITTLGYMMYLFEAGGTLLSSDYNRATFSTKAGLDALQFYTDLFLKYKVSPPATLSYTEDDYRTMMAQNRVAMAIGGPWSIPLIEMANPAIKGNYGFTIHPYLKEPASVLGGWATVIAKKSKHKDAAWEFIKYITSKDVWMWWIDQYRGPMPARMDVCLESPILSQDPKWKVIIDIFPTAHIRPPIAEWTKISYTIQSMIQKVLSKKMGAAQALIWGKTEVDKILGSE